MHLLVVTRRLGVSVLVSELVIYAILGPPSEARQAFVLCVHLHSNALLWLDTSPQLPIICRLRHRKKEREHNRSAIGERCYRKHERILSLSLCRFLSGKHKSPLQLIDVDRLRVVTLLDFMEHAWGRLSVPASAQRERAASFSVGKSR